MDSEQLQQALEFIIRNKYYFKIISSREVSSVDIEKGKTSFIIIHISPPDRGNVGHFVVCEFHPSGEITLFDSYGLDAKNYLHHVPFKVTEQVLQQLQHNSSELCAWYIIYYIFARVQTKKTLHELYQPFSTNTKDNDEKIKSFARRLFRQMIKSPRSQHTALRSICMCEYISCMNHNAV